MRIVFDMETQDPDDFVTLLLLLGHPAVDLVAVTVNPGTRHQIGWVRRALDWFSVDIPVGARRPDAERTHVSGWHERAYGVSAPSDDALPAVDVLAECCDPDTTLLTGAPLHNIGAVLRERTDFEVGRWVCQGGFAGEGVVPLERQLEKFRGLRVCPTYNLGNHRKSAERALADPRMGERWLVSKNVCHSVLYDRRIHDAVALAKPGRPHLVRIWDGMDVYLRGPLRNEAIDAQQIRLILEDGTRETVSLSDALARARDAGRDLVEARSEGDPRLCQIREWTDVDQASYGKLIHDPFAACCAIDPSIAEWAEVEMFREGSAWGARLAPGSGTRIVTGWDRNAFVRTFLA